MTTAFTQKSISASSYKRRYASTHVLFQATQITTAGFLSTYMLSLGYSNAFIGILLAAANIISAILQPATGSFLDKTRKITIQTFCTILLLVCIVLSVLLLFRNLGTMPRAVCLAAIISILYLIQPLVYSLNFILEKMGVRNNFGFCRGMGSVTYAVMSAAIGALLVYFDIFKIPMLSIVIFAIYIILFLSMKNVRRDAPPVADADQALISEATARPQENSKALSLLEFARTYKKFMIFLIGCSLVMAGQYFFSYFALQVVMPLGGGTKEMGFAVAICAAIEFPFMAIFNKMNKKFSIFSLLAFSAIMLFVKALVTLLAGSIMMVYIAMLLESVSFGWYFPGVTIYVDKVIPRSDLVKGQSLLTTTYTLSGIIASLVGGLMMNFMSVHAALGAFLVIVAAGAVIFIFSMEKKVDQPCAAADIKNVLPHCS